MRVVHYMNQFFGGLGGEESASIEPQVKEEAVGPGRLLEQVLGPDAQVVKTIIAGDNYAAENLEALKELALKETRDAQAELFIAGPCFEAGRYGLAAGALCAAVQEELGIPAVTGMAAENPGVDLFRQDIYIVDSGESVNAMRDVMTRMVNIANKLLRKEELGLPSEEGYLPQGVMRDGFVEQTAAQRLVEMAYAKVQGEPLTSTTSFITPRTGARNERDATLTGASRWPGPCAAFTPDWKSGWENCWRRGATA